MAKRPLGKLKRITPIFLWILGNNDRGAPLTNVPSTGKHCEGQENRQSAGYAHEGQGPLGTPQGCHEAKEHASDGEHEVILLKDRHDPTAEFGRRVGLDDRLYQGM